MQAKKPDSKCHVITTKKARWLRRLSVVPRWVVMPALRRQNVAEHSFHVISLCRWLLPLHAQGSDGNFELNVLRKAHEHDVDEACTGDGPSPDKHRNGEKFEGLSQVEVVVKCADKLEAYLFAYEESLMGNGLYMDSVLADVEQRFASVWRLFEEEGGGKAHYQEILETAKFISFNKRSPHPVLDEVSYAD